MIKIRFRMEVAIKPRNGIEAVDMSLWGRVPFVPTPGMMLMAVSGDDFRKVDDVYWSDAGGFEVFFEAEETANPKTLKKLGWREDP
jgi:hypothetical protein